jgi:cytochrome c-type biogenesis protein CcmH/NrfG
MKTYADYALSERASACAYLASRYAETGASAKAAAYRARAFSLAARDEARRETIESRELRRFDAMIARSRSR